MLRISDARLDELIAEDVPYIDLTTEVLGIGNVAGELSYYTRENCVLCGTEEVTRMIEHVGARVEESLPSGTFLQAGETFLRATGPASALHMAWKACLNVFDHCSAVATATHALVSEAHAGNEACEVVTTRKSMPGAKDLLTKAVMAGGAFPHRLGLSETVLVFDHHIEFLGGFDAFLEQLPLFRRRCIEKKLFVEATATQALALARAGVDGIQFDKVDPENLGALVKELRSIDPHLTLIAAGGVNVKNARAYAESGVDGLATTWPFNAKPLDMSVRMRVSGV